MIKKLAALLAALALVLLSGCVAEPEPVSEEEMIPLVETVCGYLSKGDVAMAYESTTTSLQFILQEDAFASTWETAINASGPVVSDVGIYGVRWDSDERCVIDYAFDCERIGLVVRFFFTQHGEMLNVGTYNVDLFDEPVVPGDVVEEPVQIVTADGYTLHGALCLPRDAQGPLPAAVLLPGAGALGMDCSYGRVDFMRDMAYGLAQRGIASVRLNKVTYETTVISQLVYCIQMEYIDPYEQAYALLAQDSRIDPQRIYLLGHDLGATVAPRLDGSVDSAGLILLAGTARPLYELHYDQNMQVLDIHPEMDYRSTIAQQVNAAEKIVQMSTAYQAQNETAFGYNGYYYWEMAQMAPDLSAIEKPVFLARGLEDFQNYEADWTSLTQGLSNAAQTQKLYEGLSHLFTPSLGTLETTEYFQEASVDAGVIDDVAAFILQ